jgi:hypothetical protein
MYLNAQPRVLFLTRQDSATQDGDEAAETEKLRGMTYISCGPGRERLTESSWSFQHQKKYGANFTDPFASCHELPQSFHVNKRQFIQMCH